MLQIENSTLNKTQSLSSFRGALRASGVMAFAGLGDAILYPLLPIYGVELGFSAFFIGALLSINRFVRIIANTHIANLINRIGMKKMLVTTSILATVTTFIYGFQLGAIVFLIARILWGLSYSGLKISTLNYASKAKGKSGLAFGLTTAIKSLGALSVLFFGSKLIALVGVQKGLFIIASISAIGIILAYSLPNISSNSKRVKTKQTFYPSTINLMVFMLSLTIGITVVTLSKLIQTSASMSDVLIVVASYLFLKELFVVLFSIIGGFISAVYLIPNQDIDLNPTTVQELIDLGFSNVGRQYFPDEIFGEEVFFSLKGFLILLISGLFIGFGTRYAGGCTSGHAITGLSSLQLPSLLAVIGFFIGGIVATWFIIPMLF